LAQMVRRAQPPPPPPPPRPLPAAPPPVSCPTNLDGHNSHPSLPT
jgi:hypothetical protein